MPRYLKHIIDAAEIAEHSQQEIKHGAVLVRGGKVIGRGCNSDRSRMRALSGGGANMVALHSEVRKAGALSISKPPFLCHGRIVIKPLNTVNRLMLLVLMA
eukprot:6174598-Pleurochrysis_carterae.AAC.3